MLISKPLFYVTDRKPGDPLVEIDSTYGKVYHLGSPADLMEMTERENALIFMPHPRSKGSTGFPDAVKDKPYFQHENYRGRGIAGAWASTPPKSVCANIGAWACGMS